MIKKSLIFAIILFFSFGSKAQDTLYLMNGKTKLAWVDSLTSEYVYFREFKDGSAKKRTKRRDKENYFAIHYKNGTNEQIYKNDPYLGDTLTVEQMEMYLLGRNQARKYNRPHKTFLVGVAVGAGLGIYVEAQPKIITQTDTIILVPPYPYWELIPLGAFVYGASLYFTPDKWKADDQTWFADPYFLMGYAHTASNRQTKAAFFGAVGSYLVVVLGDLAFNNQLNN